METAYTGAARRELAFVVFLASAGLALVMLVAFAPWYGVVSGAGAGSVRPAVVQPAKVAPAKAVPMKKAVPVGLAEVDAALGR